MPPEEDDDNTPLEIFWDELHASRARPTEPLPPEPPKGPPGALVIGTSQDRILITIHADGRLEYGPDYTPDETAMVFWEEMGRRRLQMEERLLLIGHMEATLTRLGVADLHNQAADERLRSRISDTNLRESQRAQHNLERAMHQAIELGRGMARRPDIPVPAPPERIPEVIRNNPDSSYGESDPGVPDV
jgi:hypothetical protein